MCIYFRKIKKIFFESLVENAYRLCSKNRLFHLFLFNLSVKYNCAATQHHIHIEEQKMNFLFKWWKQRQAFRETYNHLHKLSTRELDDIGINRTMITRIAMESSRKVRDEADI